VTRFARGTTGHAGTDRFRGHAYAHLVHGDHCRRRMPAFAGRPHTIVVGHTTDDRGWFFGIDRVAGRCRKRWIFGWTQRWTYCRPRDISCLARRMGLTDAATRIFMFSGGRHLSGAAVLRCERPVSYAAFPSDRVLLIFAENPSNRLGCLAGHVRFEGQRRASRLAKPDKVAPACEHLAGAAGIIALGVTLNAAFAGIGGLFNRVTPFLNSCCVRTGRSGRAVPPDLVQASFRWSRDDCRTRTWCQSAFNSDEELIFQLLNSAITATSYATALALVGCVHPLRSSEEPGWMEPGGKLGQTASRYLGWTGHAPTIRAVSKTGVEQGRFRAPGDRFVRRYVDEMSVFEVWHTFAPHSTVICMTHTWVGWILPCGSPGNSEGWRVEILKVARAYIPAGNPGRAARGGFIAG